MSLSLHSTRSPPWLHTVVALGVAASAVSAVAAPRRVFTFDPAAVILTDTPFTRDDLPISDSSTVTFGADNTFTDAGYLSLSSAQLDGVASPPGSLIHASVGTLPAGAGLFTPSARAHMSFNGAAGKEAFFKSPNPLYNLTSTSFTNTTSQIEAFDGGYRIRHDGGAVSFVSTPAIPEPKTYLLMLAGLAAVGFVARRRNVG